MTARAQIIAVVTGSVLLVLAAIWIPEVLDHRHHDAADDAALQRMIDYCSTVHDAFELDAAAFQSADPQRADAATARLGRSVPHAWSDLGLCAETTPDLKDKLCSDGKDYACLAALARMAASATGDAAELARTRTETMQRLQARCQIVRFEVERVADSLEFSDHSVRDGWMDYFANRSPLASAAEIEMCSPQPPDLDVETCRRAKDYACVSRRARAVAKAIYVP